jgi:hypothetical protein
VTLTRWVDNAKPRNTFMDSPGPGKRLVAAQFRLTNIGSVIYVDSPSSGAYAIDSKGRKYRSTFLFDPLRQGAIFDAAVSLQPGGGAVGFVGFDVPKNARMTRVEFGGTAAYKVPAQWLIKR